MEGCVLACCVLRMQKRIFAKESGMMVIGISLRERIAYFQFVLYTKSFTISTYALCMTKIVDV